MKKIIIILLLGFSASSLLAQIDVEASLDSTQIMVGDQLKMYLKVEYDADNVIVEFPNFTNLGDKFDVIQIGDIDSNESATLKTIQQSLLITSFDSGTQVIPPVPVPYTQNNERDTVYTNPLHLEVRLPQLDSLIAPIHEILEEEMSFMEDIFPLLWKGGLLLLLGLVFYFLAKRYRRDPIPKTATVEIKRPAHEIALERLSKLEMAQLWQKGEIKPFQSELTYIMREYLENRYNVNALESTTDEIIEDIKATPISETHQRQIRTVLQTADLVKFAKVVPSIKVHQEGMEVTKNFVEETRAIPQPEVDEERGETTVDKSDDNIPQEG